MLREDQIALLKGLPGHWRYAMTGLNDDAKRCFQDGWNEQGNGHTIENILRINESPTATEVWWSRKMRGLGVITGAESNGLLVIDFDGVGDQASNAFRDHFKVGPDQLPKTVANISGKPGRAKYYFHVAPTWWPELNNHSASWRSEEGSVVLEAIWNNGTGRGRHAVICGDHPDSSHQQPLYYRWMPGHSPSDVPVAEAPEWLLLGVIGRIQTSGKDRTRDERVRSGEDDATPWERMTIQERRELVESALPFCPTRDGKGSGTYEKVRRIMCGVLNEFGPEFAQIVLCNSDWDAKNDWGPGNSCEKTLESLWKSKVTEDAKSRIASVFYFARENRWEPPGWAIPPIETAVQVENLTKLINQTLKNQNDKKAVAVVMGRVRREYGIEPEMFRRLSLEHYLGGVERCNARTLQEIHDTIRSDNVLTDVIDGFLGRRVHLLAGASHSGKTTLACFLANRVLHGQPVDVERVRHATERPGKVLIFTSDCSDMDMVRDLALEGVDRSNIDPDRLRICSGTTFNDMIFICKTLEEFAPDLVIYDCLSSMACDDIRVGDPSYADPIRLLVRHNGVSWPKCAHVILHHTTRDEPTRFSGTEQIKAACEEMWLYYPPELLKWRKGQPRPSVGPTRHLTLEKSRGGYQGRTLAVTRNAYQSTWQLRRPEAMDLSPIERLTNAFRSVQHDEWRIASEWRRELDLEFKDRTLRRYLEQLDGVVLESEKRFSPITGRQSDTHYRPRAVIREAAKMMISSKGEGINEV